MKKLILVLSLALLSFTINAAELVEVKVLDGKVSIQAPKDFSPMPAELLRAEYRHLPWPIEVIRDETDEATLTFVHTDIVIPAQVKETHPSIMSEVFHDVYPTATWLRDEVIEKNGRPLMVLEMITPAMGTEIHNVIYGTSVDGRLLLAAFNTTAEQSGKWLPLGKKMMDSLAVIEAGSEQNPGYKQNADAKLPHGYPDRKPATVREAIDILNVVLTEEQRKEVAGKSEFEMIQYHFSMGMWIRNNFGLWGDDSKLLAALGGGHPDDASGKLLNRYWLSLQSGK